MPQTDFVISFYTWGIPDEHGSLRKKKICSAIILNYKKQQDNPDT